MIDSLQTVAFEMLAQGLETIRNCNSSQYLYLYTATCNTHIYFTRFGRNFTQYLHVTQNLSTARTP